MLFEFLACVVALLVILPSRLVWLVPMASFLLLIASQVFPFDLLRKLDLSSGTLMTQFLFVAIATSIRVGIEKWRNRKGAADQP